MTKIKKFLIILLTIVNGVVFIKCNELLELTCFHDDHCKRFKHSGIVSYCHNENCVCATLNGPLVNCKPVYHNVNNIIGGPCPCYQKNAECDHREEVCYCQISYVPSSDRRRCIRKIVPLFETCEENSQCQRYDVNAICDTHAKVCACKERFINDNLKCISAMDINFICNYNSQCTSRYGPNTICGSTTQKCVCTSNYYASVHNSTCLKSMKYLTTCIEPIQCIDALGIGGTCRDSLCQCADNYFSDKKRTSEGYSTTVCTAFNELGQYCRYNDDCYQHHLMESDQTMVCSYGECNCKLGYIPDKHGECVPDSAADIKSTMVLIVFMLSLIVFVNKLVLN